MVSIPAPTPRHQLISGRWQIPMEELRVEKIHEIQQASNSAIASMTAGYTVGEVQSFEQQRRGAADILAGNTASQKLHEDAGFRVVGYRERIAQDRFGSWHDTLLMERRSAL